MLTITTNLTELNIKRFLIRFSEGLLKLSEVPVSAPEKKKSDKLDSKVNMNTFPVHDD